MPGRRVLTPSQIREFRAALLAWFDLHKRDLPWRRTRDPYAIWVSEVMLQQTRVAAVLDHYASWMTRFPAVEALAASREDDVLAAWSGLGYYRRARFLHRGAKKVVAEHNGTLPRSAAELRLLPGVGAYTSAAIASIAFGEAEAVVDGNVERVLLRQLGNGENGANRKSEDVVPQTGKLVKASDIRRLASQLIDPSRPGDFNQAIMELGATVCLPRNPLCLQCPVQKSCRTRGEHPVNARKQTANVDVSYALIQRQRNGSAEVLLERRGANSTVMPGMWELPEHNADSAAEKPLLILRHAIMQANYRVLVVACSRTPVAPSSSKEIQRWIRVEDMQKLPLTGLARKIFLRLGVLTRP